MESHRQSGMDADRQPPEEEGSQSPKIGPMVAAGPNWSKTGNNRRKAIFLVAALLVAAGIWHASLRRPMGPDEGFALPGPPPNSPSARPTLRIGTFNIHSGKGRDGRLDLERTAKCLEGLDIVALNEVRGASYREPPSQVEILARRLDAGWLFAPGEHRYYCQYFGNALLSRQPVRFWQRIPLACRDERSHRNVILAAIPHGGKVIRLLLTHLTRRTDEARAHQFQAVAELFLALEPPSVLLGDMNTSANDPAMQQLLTAPGVVDPLREAAVDVPPRIDWILTRGFRTVAAGMRDEGASDHPLVWEELELLETTENRYNGR